MTDFKTKTQDYWKKKLSPEAFKVLREKGTESPFTGKYYNNHKTGMYVCAACGQELFSSKTKFDSGSGWPSFDNPVNREHVDLFVDKRLGLIRTEVNCRRCGSHLGHLFDDGPKETSGKRYCINSCSLDFKPEK
jgi:peptide-methionine (R)-S-oxide reductase